MHTALSRPLSRNLILAGLAFFGTVSGFAATTSPAQGAARGGAYVASLAHPLEAPKQQILDGALWRCEGSTCSAPASGGRAVLACNRIARTFGEVARFETPRGELTAEDLTRCNAAQ